MSIVDIRKETEKASLRVRTTFFVFTDTQTHIRGAVVVDKEKNKGVVFPLTRKTNKNMLVFLSEVFTKGDSIVQAMFQDAYQNKTPIQIRDESIPWSSYRIIVENPTQIQEDSSCEIIEI